MLFPPWGLSMMCVYVCVRVRERETESEWERQRETETERATREKETEWDIAKCMCICWCVSVSLYWFAPVTMSHVCPWNRPLGVQMILLLFQTRACNWMYPIRKLSSSDHLNTSSHVILTTHSTCTVVWINLHAYKFTHTLVKGHTDPHMHPSWKCKIDVLNTATCQENLRLSETASLFSLCYNSEIVSIPLIYHVTLNYVKDW